MAKFINPYNFIPLTGKESSVADYNPDEKRLSGVIEYSLLTKTPLFIPNTSNDHAIYPELKNEKENNETDINNYHKSYEFFSYENLSGIKKPKKLSELSEPVIPGSEIRGMLRSNYEVITNSCLSSMEDMVLSRRSCQVFEAGLIKKIGNSTYKLCEAKDCLLRTEGENNLTVDKEWKDDNSHNSRKCYIQEQLKEGQKVKVLLSFKNNKPLVTDIFTDITISGNGYKDGYVIKGMDGPKITDKFGNTQKNQKHCCHIFIKVDIDKKNTNTKKDADAKKAADIERINRNFKVDVLLKAIDAYKDNNKSAYKEYADELKNFMENAKTGEYFPVYYSIADRQYYLSCASITREIYETSAKSLAGKHFACADRNNLCPSCSLFGTVVTGKHNFAVASRIRMSDMVLAEEQKALVKENNKTCDGAYGNIYDNVITLKELASPKLNNAEFYLKRPADAWMWTYDYYTDRKGKTYSYQPQMNGRKFYWHNPAVKTEDMGTDEKTIRNTTVRPVRKGIKFTGKLYFNKISEKELRQLIYLINTGDAQDIENKKHGYKLGTGKPLGMGSVALSVDNVLIRELCKDKAAKTISYSERKYDYQDVNSCDVYEDENTQLEKDFNKMTSFDALKDLLVITNGDTPFEYSYPYRKDKDKVYEWFVDNHKGYKWDNKTQALKANNMPNSRSQQYFNAYMVSMNPELEINSAGSEIDRTYNNRNNNNNRDNGRRKSRNNSRR